MATIKGTDQTTRILGVTSTLKIKTRSGNFDPRQLRYLPSEVFELKKMSGKLSEKFDFVMNNCSLYSAFVKNGDYSEDVMFGLVKTTEQKPKKVKIK